MRITVPYGAGEQSASIPETFGLAFGRLNAIKPEAEASEAIRRALKNLTGNVDLIRIRQAKTVAIAVSDITRPVPNRLILPELLNWLNDFGVEDANIRVIIGGGLHRPAIREDIELMFGCELAGRVEILAHDARAVNELAYLGVTSAGTPVYVNKYFFNANVKICTGMIDPHQFMGFTAGVKAAAIGLGGKETVERNHSLMFSDDADLGKLDNNPARLDLEEIGRMIGIDMIVNVVLNERKEILHAVAGCPIEAHCAGVKFARSVFGVSLCLADIVVSSPGGFPKDINVYQAQKALTPASQIVNPGGTIILVAECREGAGEDLFEEEMKLYTSPHQILEVFRKKPFVAGAHKAYLWARTLAAARVILVSDRMSPELAKLLMIEVHRSLEDAMADVLPRYKADCTIAVLPYAASLIPLLKERTFEHA